MRCKNCDLTVDNDAKFCPKCGAAIEQKIVNNIPNAPKINMNELSLLFTDAKPLALFAIVLSLASICFQLYDAYEIFAMGEANYYASLLKMNERSFVVFSFIVLTPTLASLIYFLIAGIKTIAVDTDSDRFIKKLEKDMRFFRWFGIFYAIAIIIVAFGVFGGVLQFLVQVALFGLPAFLIAKIQKRYMLAWQMIKGE